MSHDRQFATTTRVLSSEGRLRRIVADVLMDMETRGRLMSGQGNAILVSDSIYAACRLYEMFEATDLKGKVAIVTSYKPNPADIKGEATGEGKEGATLVFDRHDRHLRYRRSSQGGERRGHPSLRPA